jgi:large subunit ribosomal protein L21
MYAIIKVAGRQYRAVEGEFIDVDRLPYETGEEITIDEVLLVRGEDEVAVGDPIITNVSVKATVEEQFRGEKLIVYKYRQRTSYRRKKGHRQYHTRLRINEIVVN